MTEGFERKYPDFIDRMDKQKESRKLAKEIEAEIFKNAFGNLI